MRAWMPILVILGTSLGCTNTQLRHSTARQVNTLTDLQHEIVLDNLAAFTCNVDSIPFQANLNSGATQVVDTGAVGSQVIGSVAVNLGLSRGVVDQWGMTPVTDEVTLRMLRIAYRRALGFDEDLYTDDFANRVAHRLKSQLQFGGDVGLANSLMYARGPSLPQLLDRAGWKGENEVGFKTSDLAVRRWKKDTSDVITLGSDRIIQRGEILTDENLDMTPVMANGVPVVLPGEKDPRVLVATPYAAEVRRQVYAINNYLLDIYPGWLQQTGKKSMIPRCACYVGQHRECGCHCYVWVNPEDHAAFEDFTLRILRLINMIEQTEFGVANAGAIYSPVPAAAF